jgi:hypothetical protein
VVSVAGMSTLGTEAVANGGSADNSDRRPMPGASDTERLLTDPIDAHCCAKLLGIFRQYSATNFLSDLI